jgi:flagellar hook-length control protein FliK
VIGTLKIAEFQPQRLPEPGPYTLESGKKGGDSPFGISFSDMLAAYSDKTISGVDDRRAESAVKPEEGAENTQNAASEEISGREKARETEENDGNDEKMTLSDQNPAFTPPIASESPAENASSSGLEAALAGEEAGDEKTGDAADGTDKAARRKSGGLSEKGSGEREDGGKIVVEQPAAHDTGRTPRPDAAAAPSGAAPEKSGESGEEAGFENEAQPLIVEHEKLPGEKEEKPLSEAKAERGERVAAGELLSSQGGKESASEGGSKNGREKRDGEAVSPRERLSNKRERTVKVEVRDMRTESAGAAISAVHEKSAPLAGGRGGETELVVELKSAGAGGGAPADGAVKDPAAFGAFKAEKSLENFLARELHQNLNGDIVRQAQVMLRDGGEGTIRLALRPESLGNVKIRLELSENKITGKIIVETPEALRAFEQERAALEEAFRESGFAGASLDTALSGGGAGAEERREGAALSWTRTAGLGASRYDAAAEERDELTRLSLRAAGEGAGIDVLA